MGVMESHLEHRHWTLIELPRVTIGKSPLPTGKWHLDGAIIWAEQRDQWVHTLLSKKVPIVSFGSEWTGVAGIATINFQMDHLHHEVLSHFKKLGLRHTLALAHHLDQRPATRRVLERFASAAVQAGMTSVVRDIGGKWSPGTVPHRLLKPETEHELAGFLKALPKPAGVYCVSDHIGFIVCSVAARLGLKVPEDLAVVGQGGNLVGAFAHPPLTTVTGPARETGRTMAECLANWLTTGSPPVANREIPGAHLVKRASTVGKSGSATLEAIRRFISQNAAQGVSLGDLTALSGLGVKTLCRRYQAVFGIDPLSESHDLRMSEAKRLLAEPNSSIAEVATTCGFSSQAALYNYFKRHTGSAPSEFRNKAAR